MPSEPAADAPVQRLHPSSLIFGLGSAARSLIVPGIILLFASRSGGYEAWVMVLFVPVSVGILAKYLTYHYRLGPEDLVIREGILTRNERHIPYARIQNIDLIQNPLHRLLGVAVVRIETGSGGKAEAEIKVLSLGAVEEMRSRVFPDGVSGGRVPDAAEVAEPGRIPATAPPVVAGQALVELSVRDLVVMGVISNRGMVVVAAAVGLLSQTGLFDFDADRWKRSDLETFQWIPDAIVATWPLGIVVALAGALIALSIVTRLLSIVWAVVQFYGFSLVKRGDDLRADYGLMTRVSATVPSHRIQLVSTHMSRLHRWFDRQAVQVETAGGGGGEGGEGATSRSQWLAPVIARSRVGPLIAQVLPGIDVDAVDWQPIEARAWKRIFKRGLFWVIPLSIIAAYAMRPWGVLVAVPALWLAYQHSRRWVAATGYALLPGAILFRSGWWGQRLSIVRFNKIQVLDLSQSPFDRRLAMATLSVDTAGAGPAGHRIDIPYLATATAREIEARLLAETSRTAFRW